MTRIRIAPRGLLGGGNGRAGKVLVNGKPVDVAEHQLLHKGDSVLMETAGGGGFGPG